MQGIKGGRSRGEKSGLRRLKTLLGSLADNLSDFTFSQERQAIGDLPHPSTPPKCSVFCLFKQIIKPEHIYCSISGNTVGLRGRNNPDTLVIRII